MREERQPQLASLSLSLADVQRQRCLQACTLSGDALMPSSRGSHLSSTGENQRTAGRRSAGVSLSREA